MLAMSNPSYLFKIQRLLTPPNIGKRTSRMATRGQREYDLGQVKGGGVGAAGGLAAGAATTESVIEVLTGLPKSKQKSIIEKAELRKDERQDLRRRMQGEMHGAPTPKRKPPVPKDVSKPKRKSVDSSKTKPVDEEKIREYLKINKAYGGKVVSRKKGGKVGRGCGAAIRGGGAVRKS